MNELQREVKELSRANDEVHNILTNMPNYNKTCDCGTGEDWFSYIDWSGNIEEIKTFCANCGGREK